MAHVILTAFSGFKRKPAKKHVLRKNPKSRHRFDNIVPREARFEAGSAVSKFGGTVSAKFWRKRIGLKACLNRCEIGKSMSDHRKNYFLAFYLIKVLNF